MRILCLVHRVPYPPNKGDKIRALWEIQSLAKNHQIDLFCFYDHFEDRQSIDPLRAYCRSCYVEPLSKWRSYLNALVSLLRKRPFTLGYFHSAEMANAVNSAVMSRNYDVVLVYSSSMAQYVEKNDRIARVLDMVDVDSEKWAEYAVNSRSLLRWIWRKEAQRLADYENAVAQRFSRTLLCTHAEAEILKKRVTNGRIDVLQHMVDTEYFDPHAVSVSDEISALQPYVVFTGSMDYPPNVDAVNWFSSQVLPTLQVRISEMKFLIVGRNPAKQVLALAANPAIRVTGAVTDVRPYLRGAAVAVAPMFLARGVQNKILEAMAMGLPVAASSKAVVALPNEIASRVIVEDDPVILAEKLVALIQGGPKPPVVEIQQALATVFGDANLKQKLEEILKQAIRETNPQWPEKLSAVELSGNSSGTDLPKTKKLQPC